MAAPFPQPPAAPNVDEQLAAFDSVPLFMRSLSTADAADDESNVALEALRNLAYEGTPDEIAENFKDQGNEYFRGKRWREAVGFYTQGLDAQPTDIKLKESLLLNRAACNLELQNYRKVLTDTSHAFSLNPGSSKALFRSGLALFRLSNFPESIDALERCAALQPADPGVQRALGQARAGLEAEERKERERKEREAMRRAVDDALGARAILPIVTSSPPPQEAYPSFDPTYLPSTSSTFVPPPPTTPLLIPLLILYPLTAQSDLLTAVPESSTFSTELSRVLESPPPWDERGEYTPGTVAVYCVTKRRRVIKIGLGRRVLDVWPAAAGVGAAKAGKDGQAGSKGTEEDGMVCRDGWVEFFVVPRGEEERKWVEGMKAKLKTG